MVLTLETGSVQWSQGLYQLLGLDRSSAPTLAAFEARIHPADRVSYQAAAEEHLRGQQLSLEFGLRIVRPNGVVRWLAMRSEVRPDETGAPCEVVSVFFDMSVRKEAQRRVEESDKLRAALARSIHTITWTVRSDGSKPDVSLWRELTGQTPEDVKGEGWVDALHPDDREQALAAWRHALATSTPYSARYRLRRFDGEYRWFAARGAPVFLPDGTLSEWVGACVDIHDFIANPSDQSPGAPGPERMRLTGAHLRAGRGLLNWSVRDLADKAGFTSAVVRRFEECGEITTADPQLSALVTALERGGAIFVTIPDGRVALTPGLAGVSSRPLP